MFIKTIKVSEMIKKFKLRKNVSKLLLAVLLLSVVIPNIELNSLAKTFNNTNLIESSDPIEIFNMINDSFESVGINDRENLLMVKCNGELDLNLIGNTVGVIKDNYLGVYNLCYERQDELNQAKSNLENNPNTIWVEKNERIELEEDPNVTNGLLTLNEVEEQHTYDVECTTGIKAVRFEQYINELADTQKQAIKNNLVKIAIIDSGINYSDDFIADLYSKGKIADGYDFTGCDVGIADETGQGTIIAKIIAKSLPSDMNYQIVPYKLFTQQEGIILKKKTIADTIAVAGNNCDIINFSYNGLTWEKIYESDVISDAIETITNEDYKVEDDKKIIEKSFITSVKTNTDSSIFENKFTKLIKVGSAKVKTIENSDYAIPQIEEIYNKNSSIDFYAPAIDKMYINSTPTDPRLLGDGLSVAFVSAMCAVYKASNTKLEAKDIKKLIKQDAYYHDPEVVKDGIDYDFDFARFPIKEEYKDVYRLYHPTLGAHYYTTSKAEKEKLVKNGWRDEFVRWRSPKYHERFRYAVPVYKAHNVKDNKYLFTTKEDEIKKQVTLGGWIWDNKEKPVFYAFEDGLYPIYRVYNPNNQDHLLTTDKGEYDKLVRLGWTGENEKMYTDERYKGNDKKEAY